MRKISKSQKDLKKIFKINSKIEIFVHRNDELRTRLVRYEIRSARIESHLIDFGNQCRDKSSDNFNGFSFTEKQTTKCKHAATHSYTMCTTHIHSLFPFAVPKALPLSQKQSKSRRAFSISFQSCLCNTVCNCVFATPSSYSSPYKNQTIQTKCSITRFYIMIAILLVLLVSHIYVCPFS